jgi:hypothetical protein
VCDGPRLHDLYIDPFDGEIATEAYRLGELVKRAQETGRRVPVSVERAAADLWRWAGRDLTPRGRQLVGASRYDTPLPFADAGGDGGRLL